MSADELLVKDVCVSVSIKNDLSFTRKILFTTVLITPAGTFLILEKKYPFIKVVKNRIYTLAYPVFIKIKACKAIFQRINNTSSNKNYETSKFFAHPAA